MSTEVSSFHKARREASALVQRRGHDAWRMYGSHPSSYEESFGLSRGLLRRRITALTNPVIIDLLAPTETVAQLLQGHNSVDALGIAVGLSDSRTTRKRTQDAERGVHQVVGDLGNGKTWKDVRSILDGRKADIVLERGIAGLDYLPPHDLYYLAALDKIWQMLSSTGVFYGELPRVNFSADKLGRLKELFVKHGARILIRPNSIKIEKTSSSPEKLEFS